MASLVAELIEAEVDAGAAAEDVVDHLRRLTAATGFEQAMATARQTLLRAGVTGGPARTVAIGLGLARSVDRRFVPLAHETALRCDDMAAAEAAAELADGEPWMSPELANRLAAERSLAAKDGLRALEFLEQAPQPRDREYSRLYVRALSGVGRFEDVLAYVRSADHGFNARSAALHEADALSGWARQ